LIHGYDQIDLDILWAIVDQQLPPLIDHLEAALRGLSGGPMEPRDE